GRGASRAGRRGNPDPARGQLMATRKTLSQAEALTAEWAERRLVPGVYVPMSRPADGPPPLLSMVNDPAGAMRMDEPIHEAVKAGFLAGDLPAIRKGLIHRTILSEVSANVELLEHAARKHEIER